MGGILGECRLPATGCVGLDSAWTEFQVRQVALQAWAVCHLPAPSLRRPRNSRRVGTVLGVARPVLGLDVL